MKINPSAPQGPRQPDTSATEAARTPESRQQQTAPAGDAQRARDADSVDVSSDAQSLARQSEARSVRSSLPPERAKEIGERLASGFYDQPEVIEQVARRIANDPDFLGRE